MRRLTRRNCSQIYKELYQNFNFKLQGHVSNRTSGGDDPLATTGFLKDFRDMVHPHSFSSYTWTTCLEQIGGVVSLSPPGNCQDKMEDLIGMNYHSGSTLRFSRKSSNHTACAPPTAPPPLPSFAAWLPSHDSSLHQGKWKLW